MLVLKIWFICDFAGLACPEYETDSIGERNQTCLSEEVCMLQTNPTNITCAEVEYQKT